MTDGAAAILLMSEKKALELELEPLGYIRAYNNTAISVEEDMLMGPSFSIPRLLEQERMSFSDIDLFDFHEAFAAQSLAVLKTLSIPEEKVNVNGGAIALGHPIGASGTRILVTLIHEMIKRDVKKGLATLCIGGGMGIAMCIER